MALLGKTRNPDFLFKANQETTEIKSRKRNLPLSSKERGPGGEVIARQRLFTFFKFFSKYHTSGANFCYF